MLIRKFRQVSIATLLKFYSVRNPFAVTVLSTYPSPLHSLLRFCSVRTSGHCLALFTATN